MRIAVLFLFLLLPGVLAAQDSARVDSAAGRLWEPRFVQEREPTVARGDDEIIKTLEGKLRCTCGCNLDVFTCRTTDFTCTTSPAMHRLVLARIDSGLTAEQVIARFETQYGQAVLMAPPRRGFNWAAYVMPFVGLGVGIVLLGMAMRKLVRTRATETGPVATAAEPSSAPPVPARPPGVSAEEMDRLRHELETFEA
jgi:cytochrome c-type biogenesis protein CcmH/NrfF